MGKVLHASQSGWFPRCLTGSPGLPRDSNYFIGNLQEVMIPFWRVRKWEISLSGSFANPPGSAFSFNATHELSSQNPAVEKEEDLVCYDSPDKFFISFSSGIVDWGTYTYIEQQGDPPITIPVETEAFLYVGLGYPFAPLSSFETNGIVRNGSIFKLPFFWGIQTFSFLSDSLVEMNSLNPWVPVGTYSLNALGISRTSQILYGPDPNLFEIAYATASVSAKEYWSYGGTYDTATGLKISGGGGSL